MHGPMNIKNNSIYIYIGTTIKLSRNKIPISEMHYFNSSTTFNLTFSHVTRNGMHCPLTFTFSSTVLTIVPYTSCLQDTGLYLEPPFLPLLIFVHYLFLFFIELLILM